MLLKLSHRTLPILLLIFSGLWAVGIYLPLLYSLLFPNHDIQHLVGALERREPARQELRLLVKESTDSFGQLKRAIRVAAYYGASADYNVRQSHTTKNIEYSYVAWFENRSKPAILIVSLSNIDRSTLRFNVDEGSRMQMGRALLLPLFALAFSIFWFRRNRASTGNVSTA